MLHVVFFQFNHGQSLVIILINARWLTSSTQMLPKISYWSTQLPSGKEDHSALISDVKYFFFKKTFTACELNQPCRNGGTCSLDGNGNVQCTCATTHIGTFCEGMRSKSVLRKPEIRVGNKYLQLGLEINICKKV